MSVQNFSQSEVLQILGQNLAQNVHEKDFEIINVKVKRSIYNVLLDQISFNLETSVFVGPNFPKETMNEKNFEKINIKIEISVR